MSQETSSKAVIINLDYDEKTAWVTCLFNPKEYRFSKQNNWSLESVSGQNVPQIQFGGGQPATLTLQLFFDTYMEEDKDVRDYTDKVWELMYVDESKTDSTNSWGRPPKVRFQWGDSWSFDAVITSLTQNFTLFRDDGTPVRATLDVTFLQLEDSQKLAPQNPTSRGPGGEKLIVVQRGETLAGLAYQHYGSPTRWRLIADRNKLSSLRELPPGRQLIIPNER